MSREAPEASGANFRSARTAASTGLPAAWARPFLLPLALVALGLTTGVAIYVNPLLGFGLCSVLLAAAAALAVPGILPRAFLVSLGIALIGYAFLHRTFAYVGVPPLFIGEVVLGLGILAVGMSGDRWRAFRSPVAWLVAAWIVWGASQTLPYLGKYGMMALRDGVVWGYALFALLLVPLLLRSRTIERVPGWFAACLPWFLLWVPFAYVLIVTFGRDLGGLPPLPGSNTQILELKAGDMGTHLGGAAAFLLLGLHRAGRLGGRETGNGDTGHPVAGTGPGRGGHLTLLLSKDWFWWMLWGMGFVMAASRNRGGMLAALVAIAVVVFLRPGAIGRRLLRVAGPVLALVLALVLFNVALDPEGRNYSPERVAANLMSIVEGAREDGGVDRTREWRLLWWSEIVGYTFQGPYFWTGKGFGVNLADDDGFQVTGSGALRSPHNGHMTVLARAGVPGFALWVVLHAGFALTLLGRFLRARREGRERWLAMYTWLLAYWAAFMTNTTFDVFLEGPQGGIWFWCIIGTGIAAVLAYPTEADGGARGGGASKSVALAQ